MSNKSAYNYIDQLTQKLSIRIGTSAVTPVIENLKKLANLDVSISSIDKVVTKILNEPKFRTLFIKDMKSAINRLATNTPDIEAAARQLKG